MKFNTLIIDKLNDFNSLPAQGAKKSSLIQFSDIINVCNAEQTDGAQNQSRAVINTVDTASAASEQVIQVSPQELKDISSLLSIFENTGTIQPDGNKEAGNDVVESKKELVFSKAQLQTFFNVVLAPFNNLMPELAQIENSDKAATQLTLSFEDGTNKLSVTISGEQNNAAAKETTPALAEIFSLMDKADILPLQMNGPEEMKKLSLTNTVDANKTTVNEKTLAMEASPALAGEATAKQTFKVEIVKQILEENAVSKVISFPEKLQAANKYVSNEPAVLSQEKNLIPAEADYSSLKNFVENLFPTNSNLKTVPEQSSSFVSQTAKNITIEQILFGKNYASVKPGESVLSKNIFDGLSNEEKLTFRNAFSTGDIISSEYSSETVKTISALPKTENVTTMPPNYVEALPASVDQQISKQPLIISLFDEQNQSDGKQVQSLNSQMRDLANQIVALKEQGEKLVEKQTQKENLQPNNSVEIEKESSAKVAVKDEPQMQKNSNDVKANNADNSKIEKIITRDSQSNQQDDKDSTKHNTGDLFKNSVLQNTSGASIEKTQVASELKPLPTAVKTITKSEIIPEFSKIIQQGEKQTLTFQLSPENLGKVKLTVDMVANNLNAHIEVENDQVKQFIQSNIDQLKQNFQSNGMHLNSVNVSLTDYGNQKSAKAFVPKKKFSSRYSNEGLNDKSTTSVTRKSMGYNTYEFLA